MTAEAAAPIVAAPAPLLPPDDSSIHRRSSPLALFNQQVTNAGGGLFVGEQFVSTQTSTSLSGTSFVFTHDPSDTNYALIGPFATFHIHADASVNLTNVTSVVMEFAGTNDTFPLDA